MPPLDGLKVIDLTRVSWPVPFAPCCSATWAPTSSRSKNRTTATMRGRGRRLSARGAPYFLGVNRSKRSVATRSEKRRWRRKPARPARPGRRLHRELQTGKPRQTWVQLRRHARAQPAPGLLLDHRLRKDRDRGVIRPGTTRSCRPNRASCPSPARQTVRPSRTGIATADYLAGLYAFGGILLALRHRDRTGRGQHIDISLYDSMLSTLSMPAGRHAGHR